MKNAIKELENSLQHLNREIKNILKTDLNDIKTNDPEQLFIQSEFKGVLDKLGSVSDRLDYLSRPIIGKYKLQKNNMGRYECAGHEYTCGCVIEYLMYDEFLEKHIWILDRIEHNGNDYYAVRNKDLKLKGLIVRLREQN